MWRCAHLQLPSGCMIWDSIIKEMTYMQKLQDHGHGLNVLATDKIKVYN